MARWNGKHPTPWDFFNSFNSASGRDLNWFWNSWFFSNNYIDLSIKEVKTAATGTTVSIQNVGGMPVPFDVMVGYTDGTTEKFHQTPDVWQKNGRAARIHIKPKKAVQTIKLEGGIYMDANTTDNEWKKGAF